MLAGMYLGVLHRLPDAPSAVLVASFDVRRRLSRWEQPQHCQPSCCIFLIPCHSSVLWVCCSPRCAAVEGEVGCRDGRSLPIARVRPLRLCFLLPSSLVGIYRALQAWRTWTGMQGFLADLQGGLRRCFDDWHRDGNRHGESQGQRTVCYTRLCSAQYHPQRDGALRLATHGRL